MPSLTTSALVLRRADYGDYDRMVTLFTPEMGRIDAIARGCRRSKSALVNAVEPFTSGDYVLYQRGERFSIEQCQVRESFYDLRSDYDRLLHGTYWLKLLEVGVMPNMPARELFLMSLRALAHLDYSDLPPEMLTMAFEMHFMALTGFAPRADACVRCGRAINSDAGFDAHAGGTVCAQCSPSAPFVSNEARRVIFKLPRTRFDSVAKLADYPGWMEAARIYRRYIDAKLPMVRKFSPELP